MPGRGFFSACDFSELGGKAEGEREGQPGSVIQGRCGRKAGGFQLASLEQRGDKMSAPDGAAAAQQAAASSAQGSQGMSMDANVQAQVDLLVRQRLEQALGSVFTKVLGATERAAQAAEAQATATRQDHLVKAIKVDPWKPSNREDELRGWRDWFFQFCTWLNATDGKYEEEIGLIDVETPCDHMVMPNDSVERSQRVYGVLVSLLRGRPLLLVRGLEREKNGYEAIRLLKKEMEPKERSRSLAIVKQLASWSFKEGQGLHEQLIAYEDAVRNYESSSGKKFPEDLSVATIVGNLSEPLRSQVQLKLSDTTKYTDLREWILQYEAVNTPWLASLKTLAGGSQNQGAQPMEIDQIKGKKGKKGDKGKGKEKGKGGSQWSSQSHWKGGGKEKGKDKGKGSGYWSGQWRDQGGGKGKGKGSGSQKFPGQCHNCGKTGHWKNECPLPPKGKGKKVQQIEDGAASTAPSMATSASTSTGATAYRTPSVQQVRATQLDTPPGCRETLIFDISEEGDFEGFSLDEGAVMVITAGAVPVFPMDHTDDDGDWVYSPWADRHTEKIQMVQAGKRGKQDIATEVVVDSGADVSVAPCPSEGAVEWLHGATCLCRTPRAVPSRTMGPERWRSARATRRARPPSSGRSLPWLTLAM